MKTEEQIRRAERFRALHDRRRLLLLPNAWDAGSAALFGSLGFEAVATTSGGVAWSLGYADGEDMPLEEVLAATRRMVRATERPLSVDFEAGFGATPSDVQDSVRALIATGIAGLNIEDGIHHQSLRSQDDAAARVGAARAAAAAAGVPIVVNARVDVWALDDQVDAATRHAEAVRRARAYLAAGADCIYPIGLTEPTAVAKLVAELDAPVNIMGRSGLPDLSQLEGIGVARVSLGTRLATLAWSAAHEAARALRQSGRFENLDGAVDYAHMQQFFSPRKE